MNIPAGSATDASLGTGLQDAKDPNIPPPSQAGILKGWNHLMRSIGTVLPNQLSQAHTSRRDAVNLLIRRKV